MNLTNCRPAKHVCADYSLSTQAKITSNIRTVNCEYYSASSGQEQTMFNCNEKPYELSSCPDFLRPSLSMAIMFLFLCLLHRECLYK